MMRTGGVLLAVPRFLRTVMGTLTCQDSFLDCSKTTAEGKYSRLVAVMVRVLQVVHRLIVRV